MDYLKEYGITPYINAHDTVTLYGASRMSADTKEAMLQISRCFVDLMEVQVKLGQRLAAVTRNEAAYITGGAAAGVQLAAAVCMAGGSQAVYNRLPYGEGVVRDVVVLHGQHMCYDKGIEAAGGKIRLVGDADEVRPEDLESNLDQQVAAVFYIPSLKYRGAVPPLEQVVEIAHRCHKPVVVDAAAQLPPVENLWQFTQAGADMVIFSGGKTLCGPQASGLIVGKKKYIADCLRFGAPAHGVCRAAKATKESMIGLCVAVENYCRADQTALFEQYSQMVDFMLQQMAGFPLLTPFRVENGPVGQSYPRAFATLAAPADAAAIAREMKKRNIYIGADPLQNAIYISPLNLTRDECETVLSVLEQNLKSLV